MGKAVNLLINYPKSNRNVKKRGSEKTEKNMKNLKRT